MNDVRLVETDVPDADDLIDEETARPPVQERDDLLAEWAAELEHRIELLEEDITLLFKAARLAGIREHELLSRLGLSDDTLQRHYGELVAQIASPGRLQT